MTLRFGIATQKAALYAVEHWHYSRCLPAGKLIKIGVWEHDKFIGIVVFSRGATAKLGAQFGFSQTESCELTRVALNKHDAPVSQIVAYAIKHLKQTNPGLRLIISFADPVQGHHGGIYQAGNWIYTGANKGSTEFVIKGVQMHMRSVHAKGWKQTLPWIHEHVDPRARKVKVPGKHRYIMPLDKQTRRRLKSLMQPYPARAVQEST
ncbi:acetyltransferase [Arthrobacter phage Pippa]|nr:acetyltransferase [Arthrobacter phage Pippa]